MKETKVVVMVMILLKATYWVFTLCRRVHIHPHIESSQHHWYEYMDKLVW